MQVKIIIGTLAFMLSMIILGFVTLGEPARLARFSDAEVGRQAENGAEIFTNNCSSCHGVNGKAEECYDAATGEQIGCAGLALNNYDLLCDESGQNGRPSRIELQQWGGSTFDYVRSTVASGRPWNGMPTWGEEFGGPLQENQVVDVATFVMNWHGEELCGQPPAPPVDWPTMVSELPEGDPENGENLYNVTYGCMACHGNPAQEGSNAVGPWLGDIAETGADRIDGYSAADYVYESILLPSAFISPDCPNGPCTGPPSAMPANFADRMAATDMPLQEMADLMAFLFGSSTFESETEVVYPEP